MSVVLSWYSLISSTTDIHDITEILLKVALNTITLTLYIYTYSIVNSGAYRIINGTCAHEDQSKSTLAAEDKCPVLRDLDLPCTFTHGNVSQASLCLLLLSLILFSIIY